MPKKKSGWTMVCGAKCGVFSRGGTDAASNIKDAEQKGFKRIGKLWFCPHCYAKRQAKQQVEAS